MTPSTKSRNLPRPVPSVVDTRSALAACRSDPTLYAGAALMLFAGVRTGEVRRLLVRDWLPGDDPQLMIRSRVAERTIRLAPSAANALNDYLIGEDTEPGEPLLLGLNRQGWLENVFNNAARAASLDIRVHDLRRAAIAAVLEDGTPMAHIEAYFGVSKGLDRKTLVEVREGYDKGIAAALESAFAS